VARSVVLLALCLVFFFIGCRKKAAESKVEGKKSVSESMVAENKPVGELKAAEVGKVAIEVKVDEDKPISEIKAEAEKMDIRQLKAAAIKYKEALAAKDADVEKTLAKVKPAGEMTKKESNSLVADVDNATKSIKALDERYRIYYNKFKELGGDVLELEGK
jgi:hypothetical protein